MTESVLFLLQYVSEDLDNREKIIVMGDCCYLNPLVRRTFRFLGMSSQAGAALIRTNVDRDFSFPCAFAPTAKEKANRDVRHTYSTCKFLVRGRRSWYMTKHSLKLFIKFLLQEELKGKTMGCSLP